DGVPPGSSGRLSALSDPVSGARTDAASARPGAAGERSQPSLPRVLAARAAGLARHRPPPPGSRASQRRGPGSARHPRRRRRPPFRPPAGRAHVAPGAVHPAPLPGAPRHGRGGDHLGHGARPALGGVLPPLARPARRAHVRGLPRRRLFPEADGDRLQRGPAGDMGIRLRRLVRGRRAGAPLRVDGPCRLRRRARRRRLVHGPEDPLPGARELVGTRRAALGPGRRLHRLPPARPARRAGMCAHAAAAPPLEERAVHGLRQPRPAQRVRGPERGRPPRRGLALRAPLASIRVTEGPLRTLVLVLDAASPPYPALRRTVRETWAAEPVEGLDVLFYRGGKEPAEHDGELTLAVPDDLDHVGLKTLLAF